MDTIIALATPRGKSGLAVIRISGDGTFDIVSSIFSRPLNKAGAQNIYYGKIIDGEEIIDEVVLLAYHAPFSFTGEDSAEIMCHGSMLIADEIISLLIKHGARYAVNGEFSSRGFLNKKMDLVQAESINDMINATTHEAKKISLMSLVGETSKLVAPYRKLLADLISNIEVNIDYPEFQDIETVTKQRIIKETDQIVTSLQKLVDMGHQGKIIKEGVKVAIVGKPNVGKSSLLNAFLNEDKAIVTNIPGTTRDIVEGEINLDGIVLHFLDTAGIHDSDNVIENIGINKSREMISLADLIIAVFDEQNMNSEDVEIEKYIEDKVHIKVFNKGDLVENKNCGKIYISALKKDINPLVDEVRNVLGISLEAFNTPSFANARELGLLKHTIESIKEARNDAENDMPIDLISVNLTSAFLSLGELLGESANVDIAKEIFARFCVGK